MSAAHSDPTGSESLTLKQLTPVLIVDAVEPCIKFWTDRLGFHVTNQVPDSDGKLIFASVQRGPIEVMYQTRASVISEQPGTAGDLMGHSV
ncbi:MAG TPA: VOC family protein, partial [Gemmatimonadaceae bacterium]|nr:VOC family protein [Gemmatimonadaceae bacterium]